MTLPIQRGTAGFIGCASLVSDAMRHHRVGRFRCRGFSCAGIGSRQVLRLKYNLQVEISAVTLQGLSLTVRYPETSFAPVMEMTDTVI
ncbi:hypothetical protein [Culturomica sp.]|uniref:hypothetical protein n=1 Tax=Culturomica sp. TaxID=1926652 RepID=UPI00257D37A7|nr:hypothetical protein [Culturomica sp.]